MMIVMTLAQTSITSSEGVIQIYQTLGAGAAFALFFGWIVFKIWTMEASVKKTNAETESKAQETQEKLINQQLDNYKKLESRLDTTQQSFDAERSAWQTERETLKGELERSLASEAMMGNKVNELTKQVESLRTRISDIEYERKADKLEKEQMIKEANLRNEEIKRLKSEKNKVETERDHYAQMLSNQKALITDLEKRVKLLEANQAEKEFKLREAKGTISTLTSRLEVPTDDTQKLPDVTVSVDGDLITPVLPIDVPIDSVTPAESADNNSPTEKDDDTKDIA